MQALDKVKRCDFGSDFGTSFLDAEVLPLQHQSVADHNQKK